MCVLASLASFNFSFCRPNRNFGEKSAKNWGRGPHPWGLELKLGPLGGIVWHRKCPLTPLGEEIFGVKVFAFPLNSPPPIWCSIHKILSYAGVVWSWCGRCIRESQRCQRQFIIMKCWPQLELIRSMTAFRGSVSLAGLHTDYHI